ncbi:MAG: PPK2 family polyphosphate kinase [Phycisphaerae bacterium]
MGKECIVTIAEPGTKIQLAKMRTKTTAGLPGRQKTEALTEKYTQRIGALQELLHTDGRRGLLVIMQGIDTAGKDGTIRHVFDHVNPAGVRVTSFGKPSSVEQAHDFLWRVHQAIPARGQIGVFNRSHYEDVLVVRVHADKLLPEYLKHEKNLWAKRYAAINAFETHLIEAGIGVLKFFLHISKEEQKSRLMERQKTPEKHWKLSADDFAERKFWDDYQKAYQEMLESTGTPHAPWHIIPMDHKWVGRALVAGIVARTLEDMKLKVRPVSDPALITRKFE